MIVGQVYFDAYAEAGRAVGVSDAVITTGAVP